VVAEEEFKKTIFSGFYTAFCSSELSEVGGRNKGLATIVRDELQETKKPTTSSSKERFAHSSLTWWKILN